MPLFSSVTRSEEHEQFNRKQRSRIFLGRMGGSKESKSKKKHPVIVKENNML